MFHPNRGKTHTTRPYPRFLSQNQVLEPQTANMTAFWPVIEVLFQKKLIAKAQAEPAKISLPSLTSRDRFP